MKYLPMLRSWISTTINRVIKHKKRATIITIVTSLVILFGVGGTILWRTHAMPSIFDVVTIEAGSPVPDAAVFLRDPSDTIVYVTDVSELVLNRVEDINLVVLVNNISYDVILRVEDTIAPTATSIFHLIALNETLPAHSFVRDVVDETDVAVTYYEAPDFSVIGKQEFYVLLEDRGGNVTKLGSWVFIFGINNRIEVEAGTLRSSISAYDFLIKATGLDGMYDAIPSSIETRISQTQLNTVGVYDVTVQLNNSTFSSSISVVDTTPPTAVLRGVSIYLGQTAEATDFITHAHDYSGFSIDFEASPDFETLGEQSISIILEDVFNNTAIFSSTLTIMRDTIPPEIRGVRDQTVFVGGNIMYRDGVTAWDNADGYIDFEIDNSAVNLNAVGRYSVIYTAVDSSGNKASVTAFVNVIAPTSNSVFDHADNILSRIIDSSMSQTQKAHAIHTWVRRNISYSGSTERDRNSAAFNGFTRRRGDCYTFWAASSVLLERAGISNIQIRRIPGLRSANHVWNLINIEGLWYHFDTTPIRDGAQFNTFMFSSADAASLSATGSHMHWYTYNPELYPSIVGQSLIFEQDPEPIPDLGPETETETEPELEAEAETEPESESEPEPATESEPET